MTLKSTIEADISAIFLDSDSSPQATTAVYTPEGGVAQAAVNVLFIDTPLHGDENQVLPVVKPYTAALAKSSDVSGWTLRGNVLINGTDYQLINNPYPSTTKNYWSVLDLRLPRNNETLI